jgi:hypothetical protein
MMRALALTAGLLAVLCAAAPGTAATRQTTYPCQDQAGFSNTTLTIVTTVTPSAGMKWSFDEAPSVVAQRILTDLNGNSHNITFKEASGVVPNLYINVTLSETNSGTQQDSAYATVTGLAKSGNLFTESSGVAPFIGWKDAVDHLATNMLVWLQNGWHTNPPCLLPDGTMRTDTANPGGTQTPRRK